MVEIMGVKPITTCLQGRSPLRRNPQKLFSVLPRDNSGIKSLDYLVCYFFDLCFDDGPSKFRGIRCNHIDYKLLGRLVGLFLDNCTARLCNGLDEEWSCGCPFFELHPCTFENKTEDHFLISSNTI